MGSGCLLQKNLQAQGTGACIRKRAVTLSPAWTWVPLCCHACGLPNRADLHSLLCAAGLGTWALQTSSCEVAVMVGPAQGRCSF